MARSLVDRLTTAYPRPLLLDGREEWIQPYRRNLHTRYEQCLIKLADLLEHRGYSEFAAEIRAGMVTPPRE